MSEFVNFLFFFKTQILKSKYINFVGFEYVFFDVFFIGSKLAFKVIGGNSACAVFGSCVSILAFVKRN